MGFLDSVLDVCKTVFPDSYDISQALSPLTGTTAIKGEIQNFIAAGPANIEQMIEDALPFSLPIDQYSPEGYIMNMKRSISSEFPTSIGDLLPKPNVYMPADLLDFIDKPSQYFNTDIFQELPINVYDLLPSDVFNSLPGYIQAGIPNPITIAEHPITLSTFSNVSEYFSSEFDAGTINSLTQPIYNSIISDIGSTAMGKLQGVQDMVHDSSSLVSDIKNIFDTGDINSIADSTLNTIVGNMKSDALTTIGYTQDFIPGYTEMLNIQDYAQSSYDTMNAVVANYARAASDPLKWTAGELLTNFDDMSSKVDSAMNSALDIKFSLFG